VGNYGANLGLIPWKSRGWHAAFRDHFVLYFGPWLAARHRSRKQIPRSGSLGAPADSGVYLSRQATFATGSSFAFTPHLTAIRAQTVLAAIGQAFYATGVGQAIDDCLRSLCRAGHIARAHVAQHHGAILLVSLLATVDLIFPLVFRLRF